MPSAIINFTARFTASDSRSVKAVVTVPFMNIGAQFFKEQKCQYQVQAEGTARQSFGKSREVSRSVGLHWRVPAGDIKLGRGSNDVVLRNVGGGGQFTIQP